MSFFTGKQVVVTGGTGFAGSHLVERLVKEGAEVTVPYRNKEKAKKNLHSVINKVILVEGSLENKEFCSNLFQKKDMVFHCAADVGGIQYNVLHPGTIFKENLSVFMNVIDAVRINNVDRFLVVSSACVYPAQCTIPTPESEGFKDVPERTNEGYGWAKRMEEFIAQAYIKEFGMNIAIIRPSNMYGPRDNFSQEKAHVIPNLLRKIINDDDLIIVFGTGNPTRAFLYVEDFCSGALLAIEKAINMGPINIGSDQEISIKELITKLCAYTEKNHKIMFDITKPDGHARRASDIQKAKLILGWQPTVPLNEGIKKTV
ncbi:MAG: NAD-dependent epimerase/dehydratase family protein, partial [Candidatus Woesearchaeota archaeon]